MIKTDKFKTSSVPEVDFSTAREMPWFHYNQIG